MNCYLVRIPDGARVMGQTAHGKTTRVLPGEYLVHQLPAKLLSAPLYRFVGADAAARDVHVPLEHFMAFVGATVEEATAQAR